jgi:DNA-binding transcriptional ArsR family regulator
VIAYEAAFRALADPTRRQVFEHLREGPLAVGVIAARLPVSRPAVSQHLRALKVAGLVRERRAGTRRLYQVDPEGLAELRRYLDAFWAEALAAFKAEAEASTGSTTTTQSPPPAADAGPTQGDHRP